MGKRANSAKKRYKDSIRANIITENFYRMRLQLLCMTMFKWDIQEDIKTLDFQYLEKFLYFNGKMIFYQDTTYGYTISKVSDNGTLNHYERPLKYNTINVAGESKEVDADDCVIIRNNILEIPTREFTDYFIHKLYTIDRAIDTNIELQKYAAFIGCSEEQKLYIENLMNKFEGNQPIIFGNKNALDLAEFKSVNLNIPFVADKLEEIKDKKWNDCLNTLGINNANTAKRERLNVDEVNSNNQFLNLSNDMFLSTREDARDEIKDKFGIEIDVKIREGFDIKNIFNNNEGD